VPGAAIDADAFGARAVPYGAEDAGSGAVAVGRARQVSRRTSSMHAVTFPETDTEQPQADADEPDAVITAEGATAEAPRDGSVPEPAADGSEREPTPPDTSPGAPPVPEGMPPILKREPLPPKRSRQADRRKALEERSRALATELGRDPDRKVIEKAIMSAGGPEAVREFMASPQESRDGKPLGWRIACLREARRHDAGGRAEEGWVTLSAVPVRQIRHALDRAVDADGRVMFRDEPPPRGGRGGPRRERGERRPGGRDERAVADQFLEGGVASFGGESTGRRNPFEGLSDLLDSDADSQE
jgi:hypothetical protein